MKISALETFVLGDGPDVDPDKGGVEPLACVRVHTDQGLTGLSEVFRVPPGVVQATVGGPDTHFGRLLIGQEVTHPERLWQHLWDALVHSNRRGWQVIILGALDVAVWDIYGQALNRPVYELLGGSQRGPFHTHAETPVGEVVPYCTGRESSRFCRRASPALSCATSRLLAPVRYGVVCQVIWTAFAAKLGSKGLPDRSTP